MFNMKRLGVVLAIVIALVLAACGGDDNNNNNNNDNNDNNNNTEVNNNDNKNSNDGAAAGEYGEEVNIEIVGIEPGDRKSKRLNSSHVAISYADFCFKK